MARQRCPEKIHSARRCALMCGGRSRSWSLSGCRSLSSIRPGPRFRERIIFLATTSRRFTRPKFSAPRRTAGLALSPCGGRGGSYFRQRCWCFGRPAGFGLLAIIIVVPTTKRSKFVWDRSWYDRSGNQCRPAGRLYFWLPLIATFGWRLSRSIFQIARLLSRLRMRELLQSPAHALGLAQLVLGRLRRSLCTALLDGHLARLANRLSVEGLKR